MSETLPAENRMRTGRPTKFNDDTVERLCCAIADGMPIKGACTVAGIGVSTLNEWRERYPDLEEQLADAREQARLKALQAIKAAGDKDWRAWSEWLKLTHPADYRGSGTRVEVSATANANMPVISVERQRELQERTRKALEGLSAPSGALSEPST
jgi:hypothetical protein